MAKAPPPPPPPVDEPEELLFLWFEWMVTALPLAFSVGHSAEPVIRTCWRASRTREAADCRSGLPARALATRSSSTGSWKLDHQAVRSGVASVIAVRWVEAASA